MTRHAVCPDAESIAELIDGHAQNHERAQLFAHFDACQFCFEVVLESQRFIETAPPTTVGRPTTMIDRWLRLPHTPRVELE